MSTVRKFHVKSKISTMVFNSKATNRVVDVVARADEMVAELREEGLKALDACLLEMTTRFGPTAKPREADLRVLYGLSTQIIDVAVHVPDSGIPEAAHSLCELVDQVSGKTVDWSAIEVHLGGLQVLRTHGAVLGGAERAKVIEGLREVVAKFAAAPLGQ